MKPAKNKWVLAALLMGVAGLACRLTSPTPASWSGTPAAEARQATNTAFALTQNTRIGLGTEVLTTRTPTVLPPTSTPQPTAIPDGPWLVYPAVDAATLQAYDLDAKTAVEISLPEPIYTGDLGRGISPDGHTLVVRAGSPLNTDELALYQIDLPSGAVTQLTPLLSLTVQRKLVNEEGTRAFETLEAVTREDGLAWSPDGRYLAFTAALDNNSADLYVWNLEKGLVERLNGLYSQGVSPFWAPGSNWLISQELEAENGWHAEAVSGLRVPGYNGQNTLYLPVRGSLEEVFVGWANAQSFISYSQMETGPTALRQVNVDTYSVGLVLPGDFNLVALDPDSKALALVLDEAQAAEQGLLGGVYLLRSGSAAFELQQVGNWSALRWDSGGMFVASGAQGVLAFTPEGERILLSEESQLRISPSGNWMIGWGDGELQGSGARLYQSPSGNCLQNLTDLQVTAVYWQPDSKAFFMLAEGDLYRVAFPSLNLEEVTGGYPVGQTLEMIWVE